MIVYISCRMPQRNVCTDAVDLLEGYAADLHERLRSAVEYLLAIARTIIHMVDGRI